MSHFYISTKLNMYSDNIQRELSYRVCEVYKDSGGYIPKPY